MSENSLLHYYDPCKPLFLQCDASLRGVGAALLQPDADDKLKPVAYASKSHSNRATLRMHREGALAIVFGTERFHVYLYGRNFSVITDHRPLVMINDKPISSAPPRLQRMIVRLQSYNFTMTHRPGSGREPTRRWLVEISEPTQHCSDRP